MITGQTGYTSKEAAGHHYRTADAPDAAAAAPAAPAADADPPAEAVASPAIAICSASGWQGWEGNETKWIINMMIVLELAFLVSKQWQQQIRGFQAGQPGGCSGKQIIGSKYIQEL